MSLKLINDGANPNHIEEVMFMIKHKILYVMDYSNIKLYSQSLNIVISVFRIVKYILTKLKK